MTMLFDLRNRLRNLTCNKCGYEKKQLWAFDIHQSFSVRCEECWDYPIIPLKIDTCQELLEYYYRQTKNRDEQRVLYKQKLLRIQLEEIQNDELSKLKNIFTEIERFIIKLTRILKKTKEMIQGINCSLHKMREVGERIISETSDVLMAKIIEFRNKDFTNSVLSAFLREISTNLQYTDGRWVVTVDDCNKYNEIIPRQRKLDLIKEFVIQQQWKKCSINIFTEQMGGLSFLQKFTMSTSWNPLVLTAIIDMARERDLSADSFQLNTRLQLLEGTQKFIQREQQINFSNVLHLDRVLLTQLKTLFELVERLKNHELNKPISESQGQKYKDALKSNGLLSELFIFFIKLTSIFPDLIRLGSNAAYLLNQTNKISFSGQNFTKIELSDIDLSEAQFEQTQLQNSKFVNINISQCNFNLANLDSVSWKNIACNHVFQQSLPQNATITSVAFYPDGDLFASSSLENINQIDVWKLNSLQKPFKTLEGHKNEVTKIIFFSEKWLISGSKDYSTRIWKTTTWELYKQLSLQFPILSLDYSHIDLRIIALCESQIVLWDTSTWKQLDSISAPESFKFTSLAYSPVGKQLYAYSLSNQQIIIQKQEAKVVLRGHEGVINSIRISSDGLTLASGSQDKKIWIWSIESGQIEKILEGHSGSVTSVAFSHDGKLLASCSDDKTVRIWNLEERSQINLLEGHAKGVNDVSFSQDGKRLISCGADGTIRIWWQIHSPTHEEKKPVIRYNYSGYIQTQNPELLANFKDTQPLFALIRSRYSYFSKPSLSKAEILNQDNQSVLELINSNFV